MYKVSGLPPNVRSRSGHEKRFVLKCEQMGLKDGPAQQQLRHALQTRRDELALQEVMHTINNSKEQAVNVFIAPETQAANVFKDHLEVFKDKKFEVLCNLNAAGLLSGRLVTTEAQCAELLLPLRCPFSSIVLLLFAPPNSRGGTEALRTH